MWTLDQYRSLVAPLGQPTSAQMEAFARFVSGAHSWYKHLPYLPPGSHLQFFLDPCAGMQLERGPDRRLMATMREKQGFHYSWIPTRKYRERFGYLAFSRSVGTSVSVVEGGSQLMPSDDHPAVLDPKRGRLAPLPVEVVEAGRAEVTAIIHTLAAYWPRIWDALASSGKLAAWPEESGGQAAVRQIAARCRELIEDPSRKEELAWDDPRVGEDVSLPSIDYPLYELLGPERRRQQRGMIAAMERVWNLVG